MVFAVLDDNALVRASLERMLRDTLFASARSFLAGQHPEDAQRFVSELIFNQVEVAIFDENLEYEDVTLAGHELGRLAREMGYEGCLVLHSAQVESSIPEEFLLPFDGYVSKTAHRKVFVAGIERAWRAHVSKKRDFDTLL
jgi:DNA-binding NarL/FixJ family response regulator